MRMNDNFNIITGEIKHRNASSNTNRRFQSLDIIRNMKQTKN